MIDSSASVAAQNCAALETENAAMTLLSIIIPTFNAAESIERSLESIAGQTFTDYEVVVQDGSSNDETSRTVQRFLEAHPDFSLRLYRERDRGVYDAMNKAVARANGEWLYFLGSGDQLHDERVLAATMSTKNTADCNVIYGNAEIIGDCTWAKSGTIYDGPFDLPMLVNKNICHQAIFYNADFARNVGEYNVDYVVCGDWDFNLRCWARTKFKYIDITVAKFIAGGISSTQPEDRKFYRDFVANLLHYFHFSPLSPVLNAPGFHALSDVVAIQRSRGKMYSLCGRTVRCFLKLRMKLGAGRGRTASTLHLFIN
jgi:glycosyltransferase involved in cell wall biosynthesis